MNAERPKATIEIDGVPAGKVASVVVQAVVKKRQPDGSMVEDPNLSFEVSQSFQHTEGLAPSEERYEPTAIQRLGHQVGKFLRRFI